MAEQDSRIPLTRVGLMIQAARTLEDGGASPERLMRRLNMPMWHDCDPDSLFPYRDIYRFADESCRTLGTERFGVRVMEQHPILTMGSVGTAVAVAPNVYQALQAFIRSAPRYGTAKRWWLVDERHEVWFCRGGGVTFDAGEGPMIQHGLTAMVQTVRLGAGPTWRPKKVRVHAEDTLGLENTEMFSDAHIALDSALSAIAVPRCVLPMPIRYAGAAGRCAKQTMARDSLADMPPADFIGSLREVVATLLQEGDLCIERVADVAGLSPRSLQRRLAQAGISYKELVRRARLEIAERRLSEKDASVTEIGIDLGYSDTAHFSRAFRAWTGVTPSAYRRLHGPGADGSGGVAAA